MKGRTIIGWLAVAFLGLCVAQASDLRVINGRTMGPDEVQRMFEIIRRGYGVDGGKLIQADGRTYFTIDGVVSGTEKGVVLIETQRGVLAVEVPAGIAFKRKQEVGFVARRYGTYSYETRRDGTMVVPLLQPVPLTWNVFLQHASLRAFEIPEGALNPPGPNDPRTMHPVSSSGGRHWIVKDKDP